jgi:hypothetical protein
MTTNQISFPRRSAVLETTMVEANTSLQETLHNELRTVTKMIHQNRARADELVHELLLLLKRSTTTVPSNKSTATNTSSHHHSCPNTNNNTTAAAAAYHRKWTKRFFVDHKGSEPRPNVDTIRRRTMEQKSFFYHTQPPWSSKETNDLMTIVAPRPVVNYPKNAHWQQQQQPLLVADSNDSDRVIHQDITTTDDVSSPVAIDFRAIADILNRSQEPGAHTGRRANIRSMTSSLLFMNHRRSARECEIQYNNEKNRSTMKLLFNDVRERTALEHAVASMLSTAGSANMNWDSISEEVCQSSPFPYHYTARDCLFAYHTKLKTPSALLQTTSSVWTREEDELLFKFMAAIGPQAVMDSKNPLVQSTLCTQLLPHKSKKQIFARVNHSLLNPNMQRNDWSDYEERRLPICMKVYYTPNAQDGFQLYCAATHCYGRSTKSVVDKWNRSINPAYTTKPFTADEDAELLKVMRSILLGHHHGMGHGQKSTAQKSTAPNHIGWVELSQTYFPHRHPQRLQSRWSELATDQDIIDRETAKQHVAMMTSDELKDKSRQRQKRKRKIIKI